jgi:hypothetical protein
MKKFTNQPPSMSEGQRRSYNEARWDACREYVTEGMLSFAHGPSFRDGWDTHASWSNDELLELRAMRDRLDAEIEARETCVNPTALYAARTAALRRIRDGGSECSK